MLVIRMRHMSRTEYPAQHITGIVWCVCVVCVGCKANAVYMAYIHELPSVHIIAVTKRQYNKPGSMGVPSTTPSITANGLLG